MTDILRDNKKVREIPDGRLVYMGNVQGLDVFRDRETGRRYVSVWGRAGLRPTTKSELSEMVGGRDRPYGGTK